MELISLIINFFKAHEFTIRILKTIGIELRPLETFNSIYAYSMVEYELGSPEIMMRILRKREIKKIFYNAFESNKYELVIRAIEDIINKDLDDWNTLGTIITESNIDIHNELEKFQEFFLKALLRSQSPADIKTRSQLNKIEEELTKIIEIIPITRPEPSSEIHPFPEEFKALIEEKTRSFCGRQFVFDAIAEFIQNNPKGYFTIVGEAGMGKSAIAAKYVKDNHCPCFFNILTERRNRPELFLSSIRRQLIQRYQLEDAEEAELATLLEKVKQKLSENEKLVILVDSLDEVEQEVGAENILYLPKELPESVYFLLTRRPYEFSNKRLFISQNVPTQELDLTSKYLELNQQDMKEYIKLFLEDSEYKEGLQKWIQERQIIHEDFITKVVEKSENNFMYLRCVLPAIARGFYDDLELTKLPDGLKDYYQTHWLRMGMENQQNEMRVKVLFTLVVVGVPITSQMIADITQQEEVDIQELLDKWVEYLKRQEIDTKIYYRIYHASFLEFLRSKRNLNPTRRIFIEVNQALADYFERKLK
jgi:hypothetical protein